MPEWKRVCTLSDCPPGAAIELVAGETMVALFNLDGTLYALDGVCPHQGGPLGKGKLDGCIVTCPWHGWQFDARTGQSQLSASVIQPQYPVRVDDGAVWVQIPVS
jgi:nitrite reductase/ring-hydroxylating ferredoxin subunit